MPLVAQAAKSNSERKEAVELGAVVVVPAKEDFAAMSLAAININRAPSSPAAATEDSRPFYSSRVPILGNDILLSWMDLVRKLGVGSLWLTSSSTDQGVPCSDLAGLARRGLDQLLVIKLKSYAEMDLADLVRFHCESRNPVTEAQDARGQLGVCLLDHLALHAGGEKHEFSCGASESERMPYQFRGYAKRIMSATERQELVGDALTAACAMRPLGTEIREQVWIGEGAKLAASVRVIGPAYIGDRTIVRAGATIGPFASVEHDCVVDCGTTVERSTVLPRTYLAPGLLIRHQLADGGYVEDLTCGIVADLRPAGLGSRIQRRETRQQAFSEANVFARATSASALGASASDSARSSTTSQPWLQVKL
jgi:carbonic anhydrase/acetyltransferase-like protein (isoleucine patch superfamily)